MSTLNNRRKTCRRCGHAWYSHTDSPVRCPSCGTYRWKDEPTVNTCSVCGHKWFSRSDRKPLRCPMCKTRSWSQDPGANNHRSTENVGYDTKDIIDRYLNGNGCIKISMETDVPLSLVIETVRRSIGGNRNPRM